jgi:hypothetical protein
MLKKGLFVLALFALMGAAVFAKDRGQVRLGGGWGASGLGSCCAGISGGFGLGGVTGFLFNAVVIGGVILLGFLIVRHVWPELKHGKNNGLEK